MFSCEFCEITKNTFFHRTPSVAASSVTETLQSGKLPTTLAIIFWQFTVFMYRVDLPQLTQSVGFSIKSSTHELPRKLSNDLRLT